MAEPSLARECHSVGYNGLVNHYAMWFEHLENDFRSASLTALIDAMIPTGQHVLDVGCGSGALSAVLLQKGCRVISQDISPGMAEMCEQYLRRRGLRGSVRQGDIDDIGEECTFDTVVALDVLEHLEDDRSALDKMRHLLNKNGHLILSVPALSWLYSRRDVQLSHYRRYDKLQLVTLIEESGFIIDHIRFWNAIGVLPNWYAVKFRQTPWNEDFRYAGRSPIKNAFNSLLRGWFSQIENRLASCPFGLTLIAAAHPR
jgi:SAM-dependent methyltransferase